MEMLTKILPIVQVIVSVLLIIAILLQQTGAGLGAGFGGGGEAAASAGSTRRGLEKFLLKFTTVLSVLFFITAVMALLLK